MRSKGRFGSRWLWGCTAVIFVCLAVMASALAQEEPTPKGKAGKRGKGGASGDRPIELVVDSVAKRKWSTEELRPLATAVWPGPFGTNPHPAIALSTFLKEGGIPLEAVKELRVVGAGKPKVLRGDDLAQLDHLVVHTGRKSFDRPWKLVALDPIEKKSQYKVTSVQRIEVVTKARSD